MTRAPEQVVAAMAAAARLVAFDADTTWYDSLFEPGPDGLDTVSLPDQPDRALLAAMAAEYAELDAHVALLSDRTQVAWLRDILGIPRLPVVPDRVVAHVTADPKLAPALVPRGTALRGGKDAFGNERRYLTLDALTAHGAALAGVRALTPGGTAPGLPGTVTAAPEFPLTPMVGPDAVHTMRVHSPASVGASSSPTRALSSVDLPALTLPAMATRSGSSSRSSTAWSRWSAAGMAAYSCVAWVSRARTESSSRDGARSLMSAPPARSGRPP